MRLVLLFFVTFSALADTTYYVDPDWTGTHSGSASQPWLMVTGGTIWTTINAALASGNVTIYFAARKAASDTSQTTTTSLQNLRTDTSSNVLTLDGYSFYNTSEVTPNWVAYSGSSRFTITHNSPYTTANDSSPYTHRNSTIVQGFHLISSKFQTAMLFNVSDSIVRNCFCETQLGVTNTTGIQLNDYQDIPSTNVYFIGNTVSNSPGEGIYISGASSHTASPTNQPMHYGITIVSNTIVNAGVTDEGDGIDIKDGNNAVYIAGNYIYQNTRGGGRDGIVTMSGCTIEKNKVDGQGRCGVALSNTWNAYTNRDGTIIRNNLLVNCGNGPKDGYATFSYGIMAIGTSDGDQWTNLKIDNNTVYNESGIPGIGIWIGSQASGATVRNNISATNSGYAFDAEAQNVTTHLNGLYYLPGGGTIAVYGVSTYTASTIGTLGSGCISGDPLLDSTYSPANASPAVGAGYDLSSIFSVDQQNNTRFAPWTMGALQNNSASYPFIRVVSP